MLVCTDSAARGIDIPGVTHVVQADFAATAIDFLHRVRSTRKEVDHGPRSQVMTSAQQLHTSARY